MFYDTVPDVPGPKGHDLSISRKEDIQKPTPAEPASHFKHIRLTPQALSVQELRRQIRRGQGWL